MVFTIAFTHRQILAQDHQLVDQSCISEKSEDPRCLETKTLPESPQAGEDVSGFREDIDSLLLGASQVSLRPRSLTPCHLLKSVRRVSRISSI